MRSVRLVAAAGTIALLIGIASAPRASLTNLPPKTLSIARGLPALVFVSRRPPDPAHAGQIPGVGPGGRLLAPGGRLLVREKNGKIRQVLPQGAFFDVADPAVSYDGLRIAFSGLVHPDSAWRIYVVGADGAGLRTLTRTNRRLDLTPLGGDAAQRFARYDDFDPVWLPDGRLAFASTRFPQQAQMGGTAVPNLFVVREDGAGLIRITTERNGAEEPSIDPVTGKLLYARWFFNPYMPSDTALVGLTTVRAQAVPMDSVNLWHAVAVHLNGDRAQLAGGDPRERLSTLAYQPIKLRDGTLVGVRPENPALLPYPGPSSLVAYDGPDGFAEPRYLAGPRKSLGPAPAGHLGTEQALAPAELPDGRIVFSLDPYGIGQFGLYVVSADGAWLARVHNEYGGLEYGQLELDAVPLVRRKVPPILAGDAGMDDPPWELPVTEFGQAARMDDTFRFDCLNVFATGPVDSPFPDAPPLDADVRIRFFAALARPGSALGDSIVLVREAALEPSGAVHESDIPGDVPMFEQLVASDGRVLRSTMGPAHVPGSNFARTGSGTKCIGCHAGHSALTVPRNNLDAKWFNASPSATVEASGEGPGLAGARAVVDRRARGPVERTGWVANSDSAAWIRLKWRRAIEVRALVLYAPYPDPKAGARSTIGGCDLVFSRDGREIARRSIQKKLDPAGTRIEIPPLRLDTVEIRPREIRGTIQGRRVAALAEVETIARLIED